MRYRNSEGYSDPTAGQALNNISREERRFRLRFRIQKRRETDDRSTGTGECDRPAGGEGLSEGINGAEAESPEQGSRH